MNIIEKAIKLGNPRKEYMFNQSKLSMVDYPHIQTIRYVGNKSRLLNFIIPKIENLTGEGDLIVDLFAGTCAVSYALKSRNRLITNDIQKYSNVIAKALIEGNESTSRLEAEQDLNEFLELERPKKYRFFENNYSNTYFTKEQCIDIDKFRFAIEKFGNKKSLYLTCLMSAMSHCVNSPGHFAEFFRNNEFPSKDRSIKENFFVKCDMMKINESEFKNKARKGNYSDFLYRYKKDLSKSALIYADPPYSDVQYSRFYHVLETLVNYDGPKLTHIAKYRTDRVQSKFSKRNSVKEEFEKLFELCSTESDAILALSYVNHGRGLLSIKEVNEIANKFYKTVNVKTYNSYKHSMNGNGKPNPVQELLFICR